MYMLMGVSLSITYPYALMRNKAVGGSIGSLLLPFYIILRFCHLGHSFVRQVRILHSETTLCVYLDIM